MFQKTIPVLRIFDVAKAKEFYVDWLGFSIGWEHVFEPDMPVYMSVKRDDIEIHLSEHVGDATPGSKVFIVCNEIEKYFTELQSRPYKYCRPGLEDKTYGFRCIDVIDPFGNKLSFNEELPEK